MANINIYNPYQTIEESYDKIPYQTIEEKFKMVMEEEKAKVRAELEKEFEEKLKKAKEALVLRRSNLQDLLV